MGEHELFARNTSTGDGFTNACMQLSNQIRESVINSRSLAAGETACRSGVQGLTESEYDYTQERFSDYLFSQDDYTAADGRHVKVPNRYDYVWQHLRHGQRIGRAPGHDAVGEKPLTRKPRFLCRRRGFSLSKKIFDKLVDGGASSPARCRVSNLRFEPSAVSPSAKPENPLGFQPSCHPYQFLLKSFRFPGAKTARKRFLLWKMGFSAAKILPCPPYMPLGTIEIREGFGPLELSKGFSTV